MNILIVEDEERLAEALAQLFAKAKYRVQIANDGISGLDEALTGIYDVMVLDIMLPGMDGFSVLERMRKEKNRTPVLLLTAKDEIRDKVQGLDTGADDYLTKPFSTQELLARVRALARRKAEIMYDPVLRFYDIQLDPASYTLSCGTVSVKLGAREFDLMEMLLRYGKQVLGKEIILEKIWGYDTDAEYNHVEVYISFLRKKLAYLHAKTAIKTLRGVGYYLEERT